MYILIETRRDRRAGGRAGGRRAGGRQEGGRAGVRRADGRRQVVGREEGGHGRKVCTVCSGSSTGPNPALTLPSPCPNPALNRP